MLFIRNVWYMYPSRYMYDTYPCKGPFEVRKPLKQEDEWVGQISAPDNWNTFLVLIFSRLMGALTRSFLNRKKMSTFWNWLFSCFFLIWQKIQIYKSNLLIDANGAQPVEDRQEYVSCYWGGHHVGKVDGNKLKSLYEYQIITSNEGSVDNAKEPVFRMCSSPGSPQEEW